MSKPPHRYKGSYEFWIADRAKEEAAEAIDAVVRSRAQKVIDIWSSRRSATRKRPRSRDRAV